MEDTKVILRSLRQWKIGHVKREANEAAHGLAKEAIRIAMDNFWIDETQLVFPKLSFWSLLLFLVRAKALIFFFQL